MFLSDPILNVLYPQPCRLCAGSVEKRRHGVACQTCWRKTRIFDGAETLCHKCSALHSEERRSDAAAFCHRCDDDRFDLARAVGVYEGALYASIIDLKEKPFIAAHLAELLHRAFLAAPFTRVTKIIPVPLSLRREKERGFNQAAIIAQTLADKTGISTDHLSLARKLHTERHRAGMDRKARQESVHNAFEVKRPRLIKGEGVLLVDDIFTTGATVSNCAKELKKAGAVEVNVLTIARAV
jgi:competence protein ComFC